MFRSGCSGGWQIRHFGRKRPLLASFLLTCPGNDYWIILFNNLSFYAYYRYYPTVSAGATPPEGYAAQEMTCRILCTSAKRRVGHSNHRVHIIAARPDPQRAISVSAAPSIKAHFLENSYPSPGGYTWRRHGTRRDCAASRVTRPWRGRGKGECPRWWSRRRRNGRRRCRGTTT